MTTPPVSDRTLALVSEALRRGLPVPEDLLAACVDTVLVRIERRRWRVVGMERLQ